MNELFFSGFGYFKTATDNYDVAVDSLMEMLECIGVELTASELELRDEDGNIISE